MARKQSASSARGKQAAKNGRHMPDSRLDFSDVPESTDEELRRAARVGQVGRAGRPRTGNAKQLIAIRLAPKLLSQLRKLAAKQDKPYQTYIHELLERAAARRVA